MIDTLIAEMKARVKEPRPDLDGVSASDLRPNTDKQVRAAIERIAKKFNISDDDAIRMIEERDRISGHWFGWVDASKAIIEELKNDANV